MRNCLPLLFLATILAAAPASTSLPRRHLMMVVSKGLPGITIYDADSAKPLCRATLGLSPHEAAFSLDGEFAYVPLYGTTSVGKPGTDEHTLHFIRTSDCKEAGVLDTGEDKRPHGIAVGKSGTIYLTAEVSKSLLLIDPAKRRVIARIPTESGYSHMIAVTQDEKKVFVSNVQSKTVSVLDIPERKLAKVIPTGGENQRMTLSPDQRWFVTNLGPDSKVAFYRAADNELDFTIPVDGAPFVSRFSKDGKYLYDAGMKGGHITVFKIDVAERKVVATTTDDLGTAIGTLAINPFTQVLFLSEATGSRITEIDPETLKVLKVLPADKTPDAILFASSN